MCNTITINKEESVQIHNSIIDSANILMENIQETENWLSEFEHDKEKWEKEKLHLDELRRRYEVLLGICCKVNGGSNE